ncbi:endolytic transglycosylase MltG [Arthrobacter jinronghuae]|uniref:Endolytic murein transglycosylase n=1 Tax=Arthrobacter jinronghuae TaxID=2964609 RepID=A0ABT1NRS4_9MICC|nr:endolytic transglycosylase MltG [Arthrobacter jinronghuae]MCQ1950340.1 endolytic transglycosylase MltG [Arthrobacter jinronghuae]MCQ1953260.1 endolytic transglycosylase MltG [Arthrobacter sp. zg-Y238]MCQ1956504.1 endolytic transglycosylase MltG [Arthrobacter jinronghuae]UWX77317.1 endolytic transglycosylase MltG [Arthrobacter jinronghuae]
MSHRYPDYPAMAEPDRRPGQGGSDELPVGVFFEEPADLPSRRSQRPSREKQRRRRRRTIIMVTVLAVFAGVIFGLIMFLRDLLGMNEIQDYEGAGNGTVAFTVAEGDGPLLIGGKLEAEDIVATSKEFVNAFTAQSDGREIQPGTYEMKYQMSSSAAVDALLGDGGSQVHYAAVARDLRQSEVFEVLNTSTRIPLSEFQALAADPQQFGLPEEAVSLEGYLHPGEYRFDVEKDATEIITEMVDNTFAELEGAGITDPAEQYRILTKASIIQAEAGEADYGAVAGSIENRLGPDNKETNGLIQSDATVTYGLNRKSYELTPEEKADKSNPYNTYANPGLPVGPIGSPSREAIEAAANPDDVPYYYWVTVNLDSGETKFSSTLAEHAKYVEEYQNWCSTQKAGRCG